MKNGLDKTHEDISAEAVPSRRIQPGDLLSIAQTLRKLMTSYLSAGFILYGDFEEIGDLRLEEEVQKTRHTLELASSRIASLLAVVEGTPHYQSMRDTILQQRLKASREEEENE